MRYLLMLDTPFWVILATFQTVYIFKLRRRVKDPDLAGLTRAERREVHRRRVARREQLKDEAVIRGDFDDEGNG